MLTSYVPKISLIVGPSHAIRWQWSRRDGVVSGPLSAERILGIGGAPIWSGRLFEQAKSMLVEDERLAILVPDFRFGNSITLDAEAICRPLMQDGFLAMTPKAMTEKSDRIMLERGLAGLQVWHDHFGPRACYIFWCLFGRQVHDRISGKFIDSGKYLHPTFNYDDITKSISGLDIVDLSPLLQRPMHDVRRLFIDSSSHPSQVGYLLLNGLLFDGLDALTAYDSAVAQTEGELVLHAQKIRADIGKPMLLTGRSVWLDVLMTTLGATGAAKLADAGLILAPIDRTLGQLTVDEILKVYPVSGCQPVVISAGGMDISSLLDKNFGTEPGFWRKQPVIDWESATEDAILHRGETPHFTRVVAQFETAANAIRPKLADHDVEQGPQGMPSWTGLISVLDLLASLPAQDKLKI